MTKPLERRAHVSGPLSRRRGALLAVILGLFISPRPGAAEVTIYVSPEVATLTVTQTLDFEVVLDWASAEGLQWKVCDANAKNCVAGGNSAVGTIVDTTFNPAGGNRGTARYTAPAAVPSPPACAPVPDGCQLTVKVIKRLPSGRRIKATASVTITNALQIFTTTLPIASVSVPYSAALQAAGGTLPYTWSWTESGLLVGLTLNSSTGEITGIPEVSGSGSAAIQLTDSSVPAQTTEKNVSLAITPPPRIFMPDNFPDGAVGLGYGVNVQVEGMIGPYTGTVVAGAWPDGLVVVSLNGPFFRIEGTPTAAGVFDFTLEVSDSRTPPAVAQASGTIVINERLVVTTNLPEGLEDEPYSGLLTATGGVPPYTWSVFSCCPLPPGLVLDSSTGAVTGTPTEPFHDSSTIQVRDSASPPQTTIAGARFDIYGVLSLAVDTLPAGSVGLSYGSFVTISGGRLPAIWTITSGFLPDGLFLDPSSGHVSGLPTTVQTETFTVQVEDSFGQVAAGDVTLAISAESGRNDTIASATPLSNGNHDASISPYADPVDTINPDTDYYLLSANAGNVVTVEVFARRQIPSSPLDSVLEILDADGNRFTTCRNFGADDGVTGEPDPTPTAFDDICLSDDILLGVFLDSKLEFQVPGAVGTPVTFYVRVLDFRGDARPDLFYVIVISGAD